MAIALNGIKNIKDTVKKASNTLVNSVKTSQQNTSQQNTSQQNTSQQNTSQQNTSQQNTYNIPSVESYISQFERANQNQLTETENTIKSNYAAQKETVNRNYAEQVNEVEDDYKALYDQNAVQKLINERQVAENMANLGLTDSGLNRTQQTAVQLSYANNKANFDSDKQKALDSLALQLANNISQLDISQAQDLQTAKDKWNSQMQSYAVDMYNNAVEQAAAVEQAQIEAETERQKAEQEKASYLFTYTGDANEKIGYKTFRDSNGKTYTIQSGINPYTGENNLIKYKGSEFFSNGYQPKEVIVDGTNYGKVVSIGYTYKFGKKQNIWATSDGKNWIWNGKENEYQLADVG